MKHSTSYEVLTNPALPLDEGFRHMSYALFRTDDEDFGRVLATRFPAGEMLGVGDTLQSALHLSDEAVAYLLRVDDREPPLFCLTDAGLGLLCKRYDAAVGIGLYLHIHCRPEAGARLLCAGALGVPDGTAFSLSARVKSFTDKPSAEDARSFPPLLDALRAVQTPRDWVSPTYGEADGITLGDMEDMILHFSEFAGCRLLCTVADEDRDRTVSICRPFVLEGILLYLLTEVRTHAATREAQLQISAVEDPRGFQLQGQDRLCLLFSYEMDALHMTGATRERLAEARAYLSATADVSGLDLHFPPLVPPALRLPDGKRGSGMVTETIALEWLTDPTLLPSSDLKTRPKLQ